jgi:MarR family transcriptional regulator, organic hydroperoxide resistance regulator
MRGAADEAMSQHGVRVGQNLVLAALWDTDGLTPGELAERLHVSTPTVVKSATRMEATGLVARQRDQRDRRLVRLYLTDRGRSVKTDIETARNELGRRATAALTDAERRHLMSSLRKIIDALADATPME